MDIRRQKVFAEAINKENMLRLNWFRRNEERLEEIAGKQASRVVPQDIKDEVKKKRQERYQENLEKYPVKKSPVDRPMPYDDEKIVGIMKPVAPEIKQLLYSGTQKDGRHNYLTAREKIRPEYKFYFPETSNFRYGWQMWDHAKSRVNLGHGRQQIIKHSFYRRRGVEVDPQWYKAPATLSPKVCGIL